MEALREYEIAFVGLKNGEHRFEYTIDRSFFTHFPKSIITDCNARVDLKLTKEISFLLLDFQISGTVNLPCNRCQRPLDYPIDADYNVVVKFGDEPLREEHDPDEDVMYLDRNTTHINVAQLLYEFITLSVPAHRIECANVGLQCDPAVLKVLNDLNEPKNEPTKDPRWDDLKNIKF